MISLSHDDTDLAKQPRKSLPAVRRVFIRLLITPILAEVDDPIYQAVRFFCTSSELKDDFFALKRRSPNAVIITSFAIRHFLSYIELKAASHFSGETLESSNTLARPFYSRADIFLRRHT